MAQSNPSPGAMIRNLWNTLGGIPGGKAIASKLIGWIVPYSGSIHPEILELEPGHAKVRMRDRRAVRNHLKSVHAIALINLAELASGLAVVTSLPDDARGIVTGLSMEYLKKARGTLSAECRLTPPDTRLSQTLRVNVEILDAGGAVVSRAVATWLVGPATPRPE